MSKITFFKDENEDELADVLNDRERLQIQYDHLVSKLATMELELDELRSEKDYEFAKAHKNKEIINQQESELEILKSQVLQSILFVPRILKCENQ